MKSFLISAITLCVAAQLALAQYQYQSAGQSYGPSNGYQQRKMAPTPQTYGQQQQQSGYGGQQAEQQYEAMSYEQPAAQRSSYRAPAPSSQYGESSGYDASKSYGSKQQSSSYGAQPAASYAKPAAKYEEPYHPPMPFAWGYDINDGYGGAQYHKENGDEYGKRTGSYGYTDAYGIYRQVDYVADENGFRATIKTNEPGTANESPADVELHAYEPPSNFYAGNQNSYQQQAPAPAKSSYGSSSSYGASSQAASYQQPQQQQSYASQPAAAQSSYGAPAPSYGAQMAAPRASSASSSYGASRSSSYASKQHAQRPAAHYGQEASGYSSSVLVPVYQKAAVAKAAAMKRAY